MRNILYDSDYTVIGYSENGEFIYDSSYVPKDEDIQIDIEYAKEKVLENDQKNKIANHKKELESLITEKTTGLKKLAINKPWMTNIEAINDQYRVYEEMYKSAKNGNYDNATNEAIIQANEASKALVAPVLLLLNSVRSVIEKAILADADNVDELLRVGRSVKLTREELSSEKVAEIKASFGL